MDWYKYLEVPGSAYCLLTLLPGLSIKLGLCFACCQPGCWSCSSSVPLKGFVEVKQWNLSGDLPAAVPAIYSYFSSSLTLSSPFRMLVESRCSGWNPQIFPLFWSCDGSRIEGIQHDPSVPAPHHPEGFFPRVSQRMSLLLSCLMCSEKQTL